MAAVASTPVSGQIRADSPLTLTFSAFTAATWYDVQVQDPGGGYQVIPILSDGGGNFTITNISPTTGGSLIVTVYPAYDQLGPAGAYDVGFRHTGSGASATLAATTFTVLGTF